MARPVWGQAYHDGVTSANASLLIRVLLVAAILQPTMALAYIDPNTGGMLFQLLAPLFAAVVAGWIALRRVIGQTVSRWLRKLSGKADS